MENEVEKISEALEPLTAEQAPETEPEIADLTSGVTEEAFMAEPVPESIPALPDMNETPQADGEPQSPPEEITEEADESALRNRRIRRKLILRGALRFYAALFGIVLAALILLCCAMVPLRTVLEQYETSQPEYVAEEIYNLLFADPDWALLYDMAGVQPTEYEGRNEYVAFMEKKVGSKTLSCVLTQDDSSHRRYSIRLAEEEVASFTMVPMDDGISTFTRWTLGEVDVYFSREESVTVNILPGYTVYVNNVALDDSFTTFKVSTAAEQLLPEGLHGYRYEQQQIGGFLMPPDVIVLDEYNNPVALTQDPVTGIYTVPIADTQPIGKDEYNLALFAARAEALFGIRAIPISELRLYFPAGSEAYKQISGTDALVASFESYSFDDSATVVDSYYRYSETLFSVRVRVKLDVTVKEGDVRSFITHVTYWFSTNYAGDFVPTERTNDDLQQHITYHPITFSHGGEILQRQWLSENDIIEPPFTGFDLPVAAWAAADENGVLTPVLLLQSDGSYALASGCTVQAMTLYPVFASAETDEAAQ